MTNQELSILLSLRDEVSAKWALLTGKIQASGREMVASFKQHWLAISAGAIAAFAVINKAWDFAEAFLKQEQARETFRSMVEGMGQDATRVFNDINEKAGGLIDDGDILEASNRALSLGVKVEALGDLMLIARAKARDLGISAKEAFEGITEAVGKSSERKLKEIGLTIDLKKESDFLKATLIAGAEALSRQNLALLTTYERMQQIQATIENVKDTIGEYVTRIGFALYGVFNLLTVGAGRFIEAFLVPLALIEEGMRKLGLTESFMFKHLLDDTVEGIKHFSDEARKGFDIATSSTKELAGAMGGAKQTIKDTADETKRLTDNLKEIKVQGITFVSPEQEKRITKTMQDMQHIRDFMRQSREMRQWLLNEEQQAAIKDALKTVKEIELHVKQISDTDIFETFKRDMPVLNMALTALADTLRSNFHTAWEKIFGEANSFAEQFFENMAAQMFDKFVSKAIGWLGELFSGIPGIGGIFSLFFHEGGKVPKAHSGMYIDAPPSREFPILVRGGETIRTERQEADLQRQVGGGSFQLIINNPIITTRQAFKEIVEDGMREMGITDVTGYFKNNRANLAVT